MGPSGQRGSRRATAEWPVGRQVARQNDSCVKRQWKLMECVGKDALETVSEFCLQHMRALPWTERLAIIQCELEEGK